MGLCQLYKMEFMLGAMMSDPVAGQVTARGEPIMVTLHNTKLTPKASSLRL